MHGGGGGGGRQGSEARREKKRAAPRTKKQKAAAAGGGGGRGSKKEVPNPTISPFSFYLLFPREKERGGGKSVQAGKRSWIGGAGGPEDEGRTFLKRVIPSIKRECSIFFSAWEISIRDFVSRRGGGGRKVGSRVGKNASDRKMIFGLFFFF